MKGKTASSGRTIRLAAGHQLHTDPSGSRHLLLSPKGSIQLNESAATILQMCTGTHTRDEIVACAAHERGEDLVDDVRAFLDAAQRRGWIIESRRRNGRG